MNDIRSGLTGSIDAIERMDKTFRTMVVSCNHVVSLPGGFVKVNRSPDGASVRLVSLPLADQFTGERATAVASTLSDGNGTQAVPVLIVSAIKSELQRLGDLLRLVDDSRQEQLRNECASHDGDRDDNTEVMWAEAYPEDAEELRLLMSRSV